MTNFTINSTSLRRFLKILRITLLSLIGLLIVLWLALQTTAFQNWAVHKITQQLSNNLGTTISIGHVDLRLFNKLDLKEVLILDQKKDTLLQAGSLLVNLNDWFFFKDKITLHYIGIENASIHLSRTDSVWNYNYLIDYFSSGSQKKSNSKIDLELKKVYLSHIHFLQKDGWRGEDQEIRIGKLELQADTFSLSNKKIHIRRLEIDKPYFSIANYEGNRPDSLRPRQPRVRIKNDPAHLRWNPEHWSVLIDDLTLRKGNFRTIDPTSQTEEGYFDGFNIDFRDIAGDFKQVRWNNDSITALAQLSTIERSGFKIDSLNARIRFHPEAMEFDQLIIKTPKSRLHHSFAMRYATFDDLGYFISRVSMEGDFDDAEVHSDDIAYFAPALKNWKTLMKVKGQIRGTVEDLHARNLIVSAGSNTYLNGTIRMNGLPDIDKTYIDFETDDFRTSFADVSAIFPSLKEVKQPRLDNIQYLRFNGNFAGFINDFVTYGIVQTNLGNIASDLNMEIRPGKKTKYSGSLTSTNFNLGAFLDIPFLGSIQFTTQIDGQGVTPATLDAGLKGKVEVIDINGYTYRNINLNGQVANRKFNGTCLTRDANLAFDLNGLLDFSQSVPRIDIEANITKADLKKLRFTQENIDLSGRLNLDFAGNDLDSYIGKAVVSGADITHDGIRIPFDSMTLESQTINDQKVITLISNEFDGALAGEFSLKGLGNAFSAILNKYYPAYIKAPEQTPDKENFSFFISTKNVQDFIHLFSEDLKGFNFSSINGKVNNRENQIELSAEVPEFRYRKTGFYKVSVNGSGNPESLNLDVQIGDISLNDSLHFPGTVVNINSANDLSYITVATSANQTLNAANLAAIVQTRKTGISIDFKDCSLDINGKKWKIQENGQLILTRDLIAAEGVKIFNEQQEIDITSTPSDISNTNDIKIELTRINLGDFTPYLITTNRIEGLLTGTVDIIDPFNKLQVDVSAYADEFRFDNDLIGRVRLALNYNKKSGRYSFNGLSDNSNYQFDFNGYYNSLDSASNHQIDILANFTSTRIDLIRNYLTDVFSDVSGYATGQLHISGIPSYLNYTGKASLKDGKVTVGYTNVSYRIPSANFSFKEDAIDFGSFRIEDSLGNSGFLTKGILRHHSFREMYFDFALSTSKLLAMNTGKQTTDPFYGKVIARANMTLTGPLEDMVMNIKGQPADSSEFFLRSEDSRESGDADFIVWKTYGKEIETTELTKSGKLTLLMDINVNNLATMNVIIDELTNDVMVAKGHGNLKLKASTAGEFEMTGQVDIDQGNYNFNFQSLLRKPFKLYGGAGSYIRWTGDPYNAEMKVIAEYKADNVKFSDLGDQLYMQTGGDVEYIKKFRGEVKVIAYLTGELLRPDISFKLELSDNSPLRNDALVNNLLRRIENDPNELNKQVAFLIIFNSFGPMSTSSQANLGSQAWEGLVSSSISGFISNQLSKQFSTLFRKVFNDESIKVNFNAQLYSGRYLLNNTPTNNFSIDRTSLNFSLAKSMFEERLTFTFGSAFDFGLTSQQARATQNLQFLPDITAAWKLRQDGKLLLTFFYRDSYNFQSASGKQNRSGAGISFRRDFEHFQELWRNDRKKKKARPEIPQPKEPGSETSYREITEMDKRD